MVHTYVVTECSVSYFCTQSSAMVVQATFLFLLLILHRILFTNVWFNLSFEPFEKREFTAVKISCVRLPSRNSLNFLEFMRGYWSERTVFIFCFVFNAYGAVFAQVPYILSSRFCRVKRSNHILHLLNSYVTQVFMHIFNKFYTEIF